MEMTKSIQPSLEFIDFIKKYLYIYGKLNIDAIEKLTDESNILIFQRAFIHSSYSKDVSSNYEKFEFLGDLLANFCISNYFVNKYPDINNIEILHKMKAANVSKEALSSIAKEKLKLDVHIIATDIKQHKINSVREDICEALIYATYLAIIKSGYMIGTAFEVVNNIIEYLFSDKKLDFDELFDSITLLKELCDNYHWSHNGSPPIEIEKTGDGLFKVRYYCFPKGDKSVNSINKIYFSYGCDKEKKRAKQIAAAHALQALKDMYKIVPPPKYNILN